MSINNYGNNWEIFYNKENNTEENKDEENDFGNIFSINTNNKLNDYCYSLNDIDYHDYAKEDDKKAISLENSIRNQRLYSRMFL